MAIVIGDLHGNLEKTRIFLEYKPDEVHIALGDYVDSFYEPQESQLQSLELLLSSMSILLWGNHDFNYHSTPPFFSTGYQFGLEEPYREIIMGNLSRFKAACVADGWLCTHAGLADWLAGGETDVNVLAGRLNSELAAWLSGPREEYDGIFAIGKARGGSGLRNSGGIFWFDFMRERDRLAPVKQIFGHTEIREPKVSENYVALDTTNNMRYCWLYDTVENGLVRFEIEAGR
jgi:hypothetical protein